MSIPALYIQILVDGGHGTDELVLCARAMECGPDRDAMFSVVEPLIDEGCDAASIAKQMLSCAKDALAKAPPKRVYERPGTGCECRARLGISKRQWGIIRGQVFEAKGAFCEYCGGTADTIDHVKPLALGGGNELENLVPACRSCNSSKGDKPLEVWLGCD